MRSMGRCCSAAGIPGTLAGNPKGFVGGITYGSNYQFDRLVIGINSDFDFSNIKASQTFAGTAFGRSVHSDRQS